jgi:hypothetical protein
VLDSGCVLEFDTPQALLSDRESQFSSLVAQSGVAEADHLRLLVNEPDQRLNKQHETTIAQEIAPEDASETDRLL